MVSIPNSMMAVEIGDFKGEQLERFNAPRKIVVATFNIRYAVGSRLIGGSLLRRVRITRPKRRPALVAKNIARAASALTDNHRMPAPDVIALQEVDKNSRRAGFHHVARELARALHMRYARAGLDELPSETPQQNRWYLNFEEQFGPGETGNTGIALLSRLPFASVERVELPWNECAWRPRLALSATFTLDNSKNTNQLNSQQLHVYNAHIDPHASIEAQLAQHKAILDDVSFRAGTNDPVILMGDFNTLTRQSCVAMRDLLESHGYSSPQPTGVATWRAGLIRLHMDWIFVRNATVIRWGVRRSLRVSDHWPVWAELELP